ncbi:hypothetical protein BKA66DRAFT_443425 [Pyrenochaeta sp. MPI-SDFR-AT-0127]|nr:hypothetical protein BKA66DRAFT_443425 [Pyrenochaeta sp. MPI-SDFR-AT-0127]
MSCKSSCAHVYYCQTLLPTSLESDSILAHWDTMGIDMQSGVRPVAMRSPAYLGLSADILNLYLLDVASVPASCGPDTSPSLIDPRHQNRQSVDPVSEKVELPRPRISCSYPNYIQCLKSTFSLASATRHPASLLGHLMSLAAIRPITVLRACAEPIKSRELAVSAAYVFIDIATDFA